MRPHTHPRTRTTVLLVTLAVVVGATGGWVGRAPAEAAWSAVIGAPTPVVTHTPGGHGTPSATPTAPPTTAVADADAGGIPAAEAPAGGPVVGAVDLADTWQPPADMPEHGRLLHVVVPPTRSHFTARPALLYLPPAALTATPPPLPVAVLLSGQSRGAGPEDVEDAGQISATLDRIAALHGGLAPIVVVPDQLGPESGNPMCVDGRLGNSRTYLTEDVPAWVESHLTVQHAASRWTIGGFSQGGTCAIQLGAGDPARFGDLVDVSGEAGPTLSTPAKTIAEGFGGDAAAWRAAQPAALLAAHGRYPASSAFFAVGQDDHAYGPVMPVMAQRARAAGMTVATWVVPGGRHDWATPRAAFAAGLTWLEPRTGLAPA